jgi:hypothetical protein
MIEFYMGVVQVQGQAEKEYPNNLWKQREFLEANPFQTGVGCSFVVVGILSKKLGYHVDHARSSTLHCQVCTTAGGKVKLTDLLASESFVQSIRVDARRKLIQREAAARSPTSGEYDYIRDEIADRLVDRLWTSTEISRKCLILGVTPATF